MKINVDTFNKDCESMSGSTGADQFRLEACDWCFSEATVKMNSWRITIFWCISSSSSDVDLWRGGEEEKSTIHWQNVV